MAEIKTLQEACCVLTDALREADASEYQIKAMTDAFYIGASQVYILIDAATETNADTFHATMKKLFKEIDAEMKRAMQWKMGDNR